MEKFKIDLKLVFDEVSSYRDSGLNNDSCHHCLKEPLKKVLVIDDIYLTPHKSNKYGWTNSNLTVKISLYKNQHKKSFVHFCSKGCAKQHFEEKTGKLTGKWFESY
jgi:hypothetical protein